MIDLSRSHGDPDFRQDDNGGDGDPDFRQDDNGGDGDPDTGQDARWVWSHEYGFLVLHWNHSPFMGHVRCRQRELDTVQLVDL